MRGRSGDPKNRFGSNLDTIKQSQQSDLQRRRNLLSKAQADQRAELPSPSTKTAVNERPILPALRLYHRSDLNSEVNYASAADVAVSTVADAVLAVRETDVAIHRRLLSLRRSKDT